VKKPFILIAEDDMDDRFLLEKAFEENGGAENLQFVENGVEVIDYLKSAQNDAALTTPFPRLIILDLNMPKKNGKEVLEEIKGHSLFNKIPVIIYTTTRNETEVKECYELGANTYIVKPISFEAIREVVKAITNYWLSTASIPVLV
jgi:CheY-like chemotaxis protein